MLRRVTHGIASARLLRSRASLSHHQRTHAFSALRVLFFGTDDVSVATLEKLVANRSVVTDDECVSTTRFLAMTHPNRAPPAYCVYA